MASQRASICRLAGITRLSLRVIVGESAGSILVAGADDPGFLNAASAGRPRDHPDESGLQLWFFVGEKRAEFLTDRDRVADFRFPFTHYSGKR